MPSSEPGSPKSPAKKTSEPGTPTSQASPTANKGGAWGDDEDVLEESYKAGNDQINTLSFDELRLPTDITESAQRAWDLFMKASGSKEAAGEALYGAIFEGAPSLQQLFVSPRAVQAVRFLREATALVTALSDPPRLKLLVETLAFGHLNLDITIPGVVIFRDSIMDLLDVELAEGFLGAARDGWMSLLNYVGGAIIYVKSHYAARLQVLSKSWAVVSGDGKNQKMVLDQTAQEDNDGLGLKKQVTPEKQTTPGETVQAKKNSSGWSFFAKSGAQATQHDGTSHTMVKSSNNAMADQASQVPTTFSEMFIFNAAVMGFGNSSWMNEVLACFDGILTNVANTARLQDECSFLSLRLSKFIEVNKQTIVLSEYKSCMLASLRSLLPKVWDSAHEVAWSWLWENVERLLTKVMGKPPSWEKHLKKVLGDFDETKLYQFRADVYARFFAAVPAGQEFFKQSNTYLHVIADRILEMTTALFDNPMKMVDDISALGLRHVGYAIPIELIGPFVTVCIEVMSDNTKDEVALEAYRYSLGLISNMLVRTIVEGSTIIMKAIDANSGKLLRKAVQAAPRSERSAWLLVLQVGNQSISPLMWSITSGCTDAATAIIEDLLTIRADRERYYYGVDDLWGQHPDIIKQLIDKAPTVLPSLWKSLVWRCHVSENRMRRVNYYIKNLVVDRQGNPSPVLGWICDYAHPPTMLDELLVFVNHVMWTRLAVTKFLARKTWFVLSLSIFMLSQVILPKSDKAEEVGVLWAILVARCINYGVILTRLAFDHSTSCVKAFKTKKTMKIFRCITVPAYLKDTYDLASFMLVLSMTAMALTEPMLACYSYKAEGDPDWPTELCAESKKYMFSYSIFCLIAMFIQWFLIMDMAVFSTQLSAFMLVIQHCMAELSRFMIALGFLLFTFGSAISVLKHDQEEMQNTMHSAIALFSITVRLYQDDYRSVDEPALILVVFIYQTAVTIILLNLLIAQLQCSYEYIHQDAIGIARLNRSKVITEVVAVLPQNQWQRFIAGLEFEKKLEFSEGDVGVPGGIQIMESSREHPIVEDKIFRFGGSCSPEMPWPKEDKDGEGEEKDDKFDRLEKLLQKTIKRIAMADTATNHQSGSKGSGSEGSSFAESSHGDESGQH